MLVGTKHIYKDELLEAASSIEGLKNYSDSLVPLSFRHIEAIVLNQRYLVALELREIDTIHYYIKKGLIEGLLKGVTIKGTLNKIVDIEDLMQTIDAKRLFNELFKKELEDYEARNRTFNRLSDNR